MTILFHRNKKLVYDQWSNMCFFPNLRGNMLLLCCVLMFCFMIENNYFVVHSESRNFKFMYFAIKIQRLCRTVVSLWLIFDEMAAT